MEINYQISQLNKNFTYWSSFLQLGFLTVCVNHQLFQIQWVLRQSIFFEIPKLKVFEKTSIFFQFSCVHYSVYFQVQLVFFVYRKAISIIEQKKCKGHEKCDWLLVLKEEFNSQISHQNLKKLYIDLVFWNSVNFFEVRILNIFQKTSHFFLFPCVYDSFLTVCWYVLTKPVNNLCCYHFYSWHAQFLESLNFAIG